MISLHEVTLALSGQRILDNLTLDIQKAERLVILGASGSGKTTLLRLIAGFVAPDSGSVVIADSVVSKDGKIIVSPYRRGVNMVFQDLALWSHMNVEENIGFGLKMQGVSKDMREKEVAKMLETVGLQGYAKKRIHQLSGGEQQRVALARALITKPKILLMDEPLSSLDAQLNQKLRAEIVRLQESLGFTLVYVTHNETEAREISTRTVYMKEGRVV